MKNFAAFILIAVIAFFSYNMFAAPTLPASPVIQIAPAAIAPKYNTAYTIKINPAPVSGNFQQAATIYNIPQLPQRYYLPNAVHIKTKSRQYFDKELNVVHSSTLMTSLKDYNIQQIRAPYIFSTGDSPLESDPYGIDRILEVTYSSPVDPYDLCRDLMKNPEVEYAVPIFIYDAFDYVPNDPKITSQWHIDNIQLKKAWDITKGDKDIIIGIVDSGVDWGHEDLSDNIYTNPNEIPNNGIDDDKNGYIDDVRGWDLVGNVSQNEAYSNIFRPDNDPKNPGTGADNIHGTHVAGCASGVTNNGKGIASPGFNCTILPVKCASDQNIQGIFNGYEGIAYAAMMGANIINCSWGGPGYSPVGQDIINSATAKGSLVVVAAGNSGVNIDNGEFYPACYDNVVCVGASNSGNGIPYFSNWGVVASVFSPGQTIYSTVPGNNYQNMDGTSMASPVATGVCALIKSLHKKWTPKQILHQLRSTCDNVLTADPNKRPYYYGRINAYKAVDYNYSAGKNVPGIEVDSIYIASGNVLTNNDPTVIRLNVTNYLASATGVVMKIAPQNNFININTQDINIGNLPSMTSKNVDLSVQLLTANPWYSGTANLIITFTSGTYTDYQLLKIPVQIASDNRYSTIVNFPDYYAPQFYGACSPKTNVLWAVGAGGVFGSAGGFYKLNNGQASGKAISTEYSYTVFAFDENTAFIGTTAQSGSSSTIYKCTDGGNTWTPTSLSICTSFINSVNFFDTNNGAFSGDPKNGNWGIGITTDAGNTWKQVNNIPVPLAGEASLVSAQSWVGNYGWFGTSKGRVYSTSDMGHTWQAFKVQGIDTTIYFISFCDSVNGFLVYKNPSTSELLTASSNNGGKTWQLNKYNFTTNKLTPVYFYGSKDAGRVYMLCSGGQVYSTKTNGVTWDAVLGLYHGVATMGACVQVPVNKMRMWNLGQYIGYLDFAYTPASIKKELTLETSNTINYDSTSIGKWKLLSASLKNTGNITLQVKPNIVPDAGVDSSEFKINFFSKDSINPGDVMPVYVKFAPLKTGLRTATLNITSAITLPPITVNLRGYGTEAVSVREYSNSDEITITPNPASGHIIINLGNLELNNIKLNIYDIFGKKIQEIPHSTNDNNYFAYDISGLSSGVYSIIIDSGEKVYMKRMVVVR